MALSRTARILIAVLLLAAAGFFWVNFFQQNQTVDSVPVQAPASTPATTAPLTAPPGSVNGIATTPEDGAAEGGIATTDGDTTPQATSNGEPTDAGDTTPESAAPVVVTDPPAVVLRALVVEQLPFLVTEPPLPEDEELASEEEDAGRSLTGARASINPFSPILVQAPPASQQPVAEAPAPEPSAEPEIVVVEGGPPPTSAGSSATAAAPRTPVPAPAPRALAPAPARAADLPRPLPSGTLSAVPEILRDPRNQPSASTGPEDLRTVAAVVVPETGAGTELPYATQEGEVAAATAPEPIGPGQVVAEAPAASRTPTLPLAVGADALSRYLRDNNVRFTGQVLGPLSVGVFRSNLYPQPVVVTLGQTLPDSDILLSDLRGYEARFTLGDNTQVLSLDTRR